MSPGHGAAPWTLLARGSAGEAPRSAGMIALRPVLRTFASLGVGVTQDAEPFAHPLVLQHPASRPALRVTGCWARSRLGGSFAGSRGDPQPALGLLRRGAAGMGLPGGSASRGAGCGLWSSDAGPGASACCSPCRHRVILGSSPPPRGPEPPPGREGEIPASGAQLGAQQELQL